MLIKIDKLFSFVQCVASWWTRKDPLCGSRRLHRVRNRSFLLPINVIFYPMTFGLFNNLFIFRCCNAGQKCCDTGMTNICLSVDECPWGLWIYWNTRNETLSNDFLRNFNCFDNSDFECLFEIWTKSKNLSVTNIVCIFTKYFTEKYF